MAWTDIEICWRTTDGEIFTDSEEAVKHQAEIDTDKYLKEFSMETQEAIDKALLPLKRNLRRQ